MQTFVESHFKKSYSDRERVMGCWLGKAVGGTLGMPIEGEDGPFDLQFYNPVPTEMLPNDDLDLQVVWACVLDAMSTPEVNRHVLAKAWRDHVHFPMDEYGVALRNMANGLHPPLTGSHDNWFAHGMGATIRSEVWACLAPGNPELAAAYAFEDACVDHAGEGIYGETFFAALESMAFVESDVDVLLDGALSTLPEESLIKSAVQDTRIWWRETGDWREVRERILKNYGHENFTDATMNVAFTVLGWLAGEGDFSRSICIAVNCGKDTDCTGATVGALMGIINPDCIEAKWLAPIGRDLVLSPEIVGLHAPKSLDDFTQMILALRARLSTLPPQAEVFEQSVEPLKIKAQIGFTDAMPDANQSPALPHNAREVEFDGAFAAWPATEFEDEFLLVKYEFRLKENREVLAMFNTDTLCRVWLDNQFLFERDGGRMAPSLHRAPEHQMAAVELAAGRHFVTAALQRPRDKARAQWVVAIGDPETKQWLPGALRG